MLSEPEEVISKIKIIGIEDCKNGQTVKTIKELNKMRLNIDIESIKRRTISGFDDQIEKQRKQAVEERVRIPEPSLEKKIGRDEQAKTRNQLHDQRREKLRAYNEQTFIKFRTGVHGNSIPNFYVP